MWLRGVGFVGGLGRGRSGERDYWVRGWMRGLMMRLLLSLPLSLFSLSISHHDNYCVSLIKLAPPSTKTETGTKMKLFRSRSTSPAQYHYLHHYYLNIP